MDALTQTKILSQLSSRFIEKTSASAKNAVKVPVHEFTDRERLRQEKKTFFRDTPLLLGLSTDLPENDSYLATNETGQPLLLTRDADGRFRAFLNVCRHRGAQIAEIGRGRKRRFTCPFHAWNYSNTGELIAINRESSFGCVDKNGLGLTELPCLEANGMLWVRPTVGNSFTEADVMGGLSGEFENWLKHEHLFSEAQVIEADINWKLAIDTFGENYHFDVLHKSSLANDIVGNLQTWDRFERNGRMVFAGKEAFQYLHEQEIPIEKWPYRDVTLNVYFFYPNCIFLVDRAGIDILKMYPDPEDPAKSKTHHSYYMRPELLDHLQQEGRNTLEESRFVGFNKIVVDEDYAAATTVQAGAASGAQDHFVFGKNEPALQHYHSSHREALGLAPLEALMN
jgi:phenylpropionate dioxygenase-like ring-hydroxylating dioxygenase large terminal subunit